MNAMKAMCSMRMWFITITAVFIIGLAQAEDFTPADRDKFLLEEAEGIISDTEIASEPILLEIRKACIKELGLPSELTDLTTAQKLALASKFVIKYMDLALANLGDKDRQQFERFKTELSLPADRTPCNLTADEKIHLYKAAWEDFARQIQAVITHNEKVRAAARR